jgi:hypothetical protein
LATTDDPFELNWHVAGATSGSTVSLNTLKGNARLVWNVVAGVVAGVVGVIVVETTALIPTKMTSAATPTRTLGHIAKFQPLPIAAALAVTRQKQGG